MKKLILGLVLFITMSAACISASGSEPADVKHVLFVGNSFTHYNNLERIFKSIAADAGIAVEVKRVAVSSSTLEEFADPSQSNGRALASALRRQSNFDYVILQEHSTRPLSSRKRFLSGARDVQTMIEDTQKDAKIYLYETWGFLNTGFGEVPDMEGLLRAAYRDVGETLGIPVSFVGKAFTKVYEEQGKINLYSSDDKHPSYAGSYLAACVHAMTILGIDPRTLTFRGSLSEERAEILRQAAYDTVSSPE